MSADLGPRDRKVFEGDSMTTKENRSAMGQPRLARLLYDIVFFFFALLYIPTFLVKGKHKAGFFSRFGRVSKAVKRSLAGKKVIWVHAVSVGEIVQAVRLVNSLREEAEDCKFVLTATTTAGREVALKLKGDDDTVLYFPVDFRGCVRRFIRDIAPRAVIILETEIWPNLIFELSKRGVPVFIVNGRISDRAIGKYRLARFFLKPVLNRLTKIWVQDELMQSRFIDLGADPDLVSVTGNMKFDWEPAADHLQTAERMERALKGSGSFLCIVGSTHEGEEDIIFDLFRSLRKKFLSFQLLIAPRHLTRLESIEARAAKKGVETKRVSNFLDESQKGIPNADEGTILILDKIGVLASLYRLADVVVIGGSFVPVGGHNLVEPAYFEKPILFGPHMHNFKEMAEAFKGANAAIEVKDAGGLEKVILSLAQDPHRRKTLGSAAKKLVSQHQGATGRNVQELLSLLKL